METIGCVVILILLPLQMIWCGAVFSQLWAWFVQPTFNAPPLSIPLAIGICLVADFLTYKYPSTDAINTINKKSKQEKIESVVVLTLQRWIIPLYFLFIGWLVHLFMSR